MKKSLLILITLIMLIIVGCGDKTSKLTKVDIETLTVPDNFNYKTTNSVTVYVQGLYKSQVVLLTESGRVVGKGLVDPIMGYSNLLELPSREKNLIISYDNLSVTVPILDGIVDYSFIPKD